MMKLVKRAHVVLRLVWESVQFALLSLKTNRLRTFLSLFGVSIGVFSILIVLSIVAGLKANIKEGLSMLNPHTLTIQRESWEVDVNQEWNWWEYMKRPPVTKDEYKSLSQNIVQFPCDITFFSSFTAPVLYERSLYEGANIISVENNFENIFSIPLDEGRWFLPNEIECGVEVCCIGAELALSLFGSSEVYGEGRERTNPIGKRIKIGGRTSQVTLYVIGVISKQGESLSTIFDMDHSLFVSTTFGENLQGYSNSGIIALAPTGNMDVTPLEAEVRSLFRCIRGLNPSDEDNFAINKMSYLSSTVEEVFRTINLAGALIGAFSLLIGAFGIANILFVSVRERMPQIGIQKGLGAKNYVILTQFLTEAAVLSLVGGLLGILFVGFISLLLGSNSSIPFELTLWNVIMCLSISVMVGLLSGIIPAYYAARMNPVKAMSL